MSMCVQINSYLHFYTQESYKRPLYVFRKTLAIDSSHRFVSVRIDIARAKPEARALGQTIVARRKHDVCASCVSLFFRGNPCVLGIKTSRFSVAFRPTLSEFRALKVDCTAIDRAREKVQMLRKCRKRTSLRRPREEDYFRCIFSSQLSAWP